MNKLSKLQQTILIILGCVTIVSLIALILFFTNIDYFSPIPTMPTPAPTIMVLADTDQPPTSAFTAVMPPTWTPQPSPLPVGMTRQPSSTPIASPTDAIITLRALFTRSAQKVQANQPFLNVSFSDTTTHYFGDIVEIKGKIHNTGTLTVYNLELRVTLIDKHGNQINNAVWFIDSNKFEPGNTASYSALVSDPDHAMKNIKIDYDSFFYYLNGRLLSYP